MRVHVGQAGLRALTERNLRSHGLVELAAEPGRLPRRKTLTGWRAAARPDCVFAVAVSRTLGGPGAEERSLLASALAAAEALGATWLVLRPASLRPSARAAAELGRVAAVLRAGSTARLAWEPQGLWEPEAALDLGAELGLHVVLDASRDDVVGPVVYTRLRAPGSGGVLRPGQAERAAERLVDAGVEEACVLVDGSGVRLVERVFASVLGRELGVEDADDGFADLDDEAALGRGDGADADDEALDDAGEGAEGDAAEDD